MDSVSSQVSQIYCEQDGSLSLYMTSHFFLGPSCPLPRNPVKDSPFFLLLKLKVPIMTKSIQTKDMSSCSPQSQQSKCSKILFDHQMFIECPLISRHWAGMMALSPSLCYPCDIAMGALKGHYLGWVLWKGLYETSLFNFDLELSEQRFKTSPVAKKEEKNIPSLIGLIPFFSIGVLQAD